MKYYVLAAVSIAALTMSGCKKAETPAGDVAATSAAATDMATPAPVATVSADQAFVDAVAASDMFEIESSKLAATKGQSSDVRRYAEAMVKAHTDSTAKLMTAAAAATPTMTPQPKMTAMQQQTLDALGGSSGSEFESAYAKAQVEAHETALAALKTYAANGAQPSLKTFASELIPAVTAHLNMAKGL